MNAVRVLVVALLLVVGASCLSATVALKLDVATLTDKSDLVLIGKVDSKKARWDAAHKGIWTHHSVSVSETLKGTAAKTRDVVIRGGVVGTVGQEVAGSGSLDVGSEYVFFLWKDADGRYRLQGMAQGAFAITETKGVKYAKNSLSGMTILDPKTFQPVKESPLELKLADLKTKVADQQKAATKKEGK